MTHTQWWLASGLPSLAVMLGMLVNALVFHTLSGRIGRLEAHEEIAFQALDIDSRLSKVEAKIGL